MADHLREKKENLFLHNTLQQLSELSKEMNEAVKQKDIAMIEQVHLKKQELINKLNLLIVAKKIKH